MSDNIYSQFFSESRIKSYYIIYQSTNLINGKIYVGQHITSNLNDGYLGSGKLLKAAINKYGIENFSRGILHECSSQQELDHLERTIVNEEFVLREDTYNLTLGGGGGWYYVNQNDDPNNKFKGKTHTDETKAKISAKAKGKKYPNKKYNLSEEGRRRISQSSAERMIGYCPSEETRMKTSHSIKEKLKDPNRLKEQQDRMRRVQSLRPKDYSEEYKNNISNGLKEAYASGKRKCRDWTLIQQDIDQGLTRKELISKHNLPRGTLRDGYVSGKLRPKTEKGLGITS